MEEEFKTFFKVLDNITIKNLLYLINKQILKGIIGTVKEGKESVVFCAKDFENNFCAVKVYRVLHCDFKSMYKLLRADPRFVRIKRDRRAIVEKWALREYKNLKIAEKFKILVPKPITVYKNILIMEFVGENCIPAKLLKDVELNYEKAKFLYLKLIEELKKMKQAKIAHGDLSEYNILVHNDLPYIIDFSHAVRDDCVLYYDYWKRDVENINKFFSKYLNEDELIQL